MTAPADLALDVRSPGRRPAGSSLAELWPIPIAFGIFVAVWKLVVIAGSLPVFILPPPETVAVRFVTAWTDGTMEPHAMTTLTEVGRASCRERV